MPTPCVRGDLRGPEQVESLRLGRRSATNAGRSAPVGLGDFGGSQPLAVGRSVVRYSVLRVTSMPFVASLNPRLRPASAGGVSDVPGGDRREILLAAAVTTLVAAVLLVWGPAPGDAPVHLYRTLLVREGAFVWDNFWYSGSYPLASYSLLYYLPAAIFGNLPIVVAAAIASTILFGSISLRQWGATARWPTRAFGVLAAAPVFTGLFSYALGFATMLGALRALQARRTALTILLVALTLGFSPLAFGFLLLFLLAVLLTRRVTRRSVILAVAVLGVAGVEAICLTAFPSKGVYPFHLIDFLAVESICICGALLARRGRASAPLVAFFAFWGLSSLVAFVIPTPIGGNLDRLSAFIFPIMLLTAGLAGFRPRGLAALAVVGAFAYNLTPYLLLVPYRLDNRPASQSFWQPPINFLHKHSGPDFRVEVVPTAAHWESYWLPRAGLPLARGWYRQLDMADNPIFYAKHLRPAAYRLWLRSVAVKYVVVPKTVLDPDGAPLEARLVDSPSSGLVLAYRAKNWAIYRLPRPTPLLTGPGAAAITSFGHEEIAGHVSAPGTYLLRTHYTAYFKLRGSGCVEPGPGSMTSLVLRQPGFFRLTIKASPDAVLEASVDPRPPRC